MINPANGMETLLFFPVVVIAGVFLSVKITVCIVFHGIRRKFHTQCAGLTPIALLLEKHDRPHSHL